MIPSWGRRDRRRAAPTQRGSTASSRPTSFVQGRFGAGYYTARRPPQHQAGDCPWKGLITSSARAAAVSAVTRASSLTFATAADVLAEPLLPSHRHPAAEVSKTTGQLVDHAAPVSAGMSVPASATPHVPPGAPAESSNSPGVVRSRHVSDALHKDVPSPGQQTTDRCSLPLLATALERYIRFVYRDDSHHHHRVNFLVARCAAGILCQSSSVSAFIASAFVSRHCDRHDDSA
jgi:hypothetical protein